MRAFPRNGNVIAHVALRQPPQLVLALTLASPAWRRLAPWWAIAGFSLLLLLAMYRLTRIALDGLEGPLQPVHWAVLVLFCLFMAYSEGYRGFQRRFSPRFAGRTVALREAATALQVLLAPFYAMSLFSAPRRQLVTAWLLTALIVALVITFRFIPQPWRGLLDAGVVVGLGWGLVVTWQQVIVRQRDCRQSLPDNAVTAAGKEYQ